MNEAARYVHAVNAFSRQRILVVGDLLLDVYLKGHSTRLCPEAPVPVVDIRERTIVPGGAANTACNLKSLGAEVLYCTVTGADAEGDEAVACMESRDIACAGIARDVTRKTITKSRVVSGTQVITRIDQGSESPVNPLATREMIAYLEREYQRCDGIIISDYGKGVVTEPLLEKLISINQKYPRFVAVDSKRPAFFAELHASYIKPNYTEAIALLGLMPQGKDRATQIAAHADLLYSKTNAALITVTLDAEGSVLIEKGRTVAIMSAPSTPKPHVAGAGDTYLSAFVLAYLASNNKHLSAEIATAAATIAIRKDDTATCAQAELKNYFNIHNKVVDNHADLKELCTAYHDAGKRIVFTNGCFDILHSGHVTYLNRAKELGDILIVGVNTDESIRRIKGKARPINGLADRLEVLAGLSSVDHVIPFGDLHDDTPVPLISIVRPHVFAKGGDYTKEKLPEADVVVACGGEIVFLDLIPNRSTTRIISRINQAAGNRKNIFSSLPS